MRLRIFCFSLATFLFGAQTAFAAGVTLSAPRQVNVGQTFQVIATVNGAQDVDTMRLQGIFSSDLVEWRGASVGSLPYASPGNVSSQTNGTFYFGAFSLEGWVNGTAKLATLTFRAKKAGKAQIQLVTGSHVLSAGAEQITSLGLASVTIVEPKTPAAPAVPAAIVISSTTQPDPEAWYANGHVSVTWKIRDGGVKNIYVGFDQIPEGPALTTSTNNSAEFDASWDGQWYVHVRVVFKNGTVQTENFRVQIDRQPPHAVVPTVDQTNVPPTVPNALRYGTTDDTSGIARYEVFIDGRLVTSTIFSTYLLGRLKPGIHIVSVVAYDQAGNHAEGALNFLIISESGQVVLQGVMSPWAVISTVALLLALGLPFLWLLFLLLRWFRPRKRSKKQQ